ncbi:MAG TPA: hypothetical protein VH575_25805 [Gemmataceae bacterium]|jgi:hypothetical protein
MHTLDKGLQNGLGVYYLLVALLNFGFAAWWYRGAKKTIPAAVWALVGGVFLIHALIYFFHAGPVLPRGIRDLTTWFMGLYGGQMGPILYVTLSIVGFIVLLYFRRFFVRPNVAWTVLQLSLLAAGWEMTDDEFQKIILKPDNVPIPMLIYSVGFFTWAALYRAVQNDDRIKRGEPVLEKLDDEKVLVWPDLVYTEMIAMIIATFVLIIWAVLLKAPLEQPATSAKAPNPSKAPWYFLGLQEMLVYYDPWMAGVVLPTMIIIGLIAIPYIDFNRQGNGYFSFVERQFAVSIFMFGFVVLWVTLIVLGTFLRGPNWNFFAPNEYWDAHKVLPLNNVNLSQLFWLNLLHMPLDDFKVRFGDFFGPIIRELPGIIVVLLYLFALPPLLARTMMRPFFIRMGFVRFITLVTLMQFMAALPIKMVLRWAINLKYIVAIPEIFFNI